MCEDPLWCRTLQTLLKVGCMYTPEVGLVCVEHSSRTLLPYELPILRCTYTPNTLHKV